MDKERNQKAMEVLRQLWGDYHPPHSKAAEELAPDFMPFVNECVFGGIWARPGLDIKSRSMCTLAVLAVMRSPINIEHHIRGALNLGITKEQIIEIFIQVAFYAGMPVAGDAIRAAKKAFDELGV